MGRKVQSLQSVWFAASAPVGASRLFEIITGAEPSGSQTQRLPDGQTASFADGDFDGCHLVVQNQPGRVDIFVNPPGSDELQITPHTNFPLFDDINIPFSRMERVFGAIPEIPGSTRLALVCNLVEVTNSFADAVSLLVAAAGTNLPPDDIAEYFYRVNKRRESKYSAEIVFNRLLTWRVEMLQRVAVTNGPVPTAVPTQINQFSASTTVDLNTATPPRSPFTKSQADAIFSEMRAEVMRLSVEGSIKELLA